MINHYFFIRRLGSEVAELLVNARLTEAISPQRDSLHCTFELADKTWVLKFNFQTPFSLFACEEQAVKRPASYEKQFTQLWGEQLSSLTVIPGDRIWCLRFGNDMQLWVKFFGRLGNVLLCNENGHLVGPFRRQIKNDYNFSSISIDKNHSFINEINEAWLNKPRWWSTAFDTFANAQALADFYDNCDWQVEKSQLMAVKHGLSAIAASNTFYRHFLPEYLLSQEKNGLLQNFKQQAARLDKRLSGLYEQLSALENAQNYAQLGQLLMANIHNYQLGMQQIEVLDFESGKSKVLKVAPDKPLQEQAARYFKKAKKQHLELEHIQLQLQQTLASKAIIAATIQEIEACEDWRSLKKWQKTHKNEPQLPFRRWQLQNFEVWMGKNAQENDLLLRQVHKDDCWLHARNFSGSHLVIRSAGKNIPQNILEIAASWAAWHSKGKREGLCPVSYTQRKYVRKPKGAPAGAVLLDKESTLLVVPQQPPANQ
jgi:predicted ribosome quality control (RQC) complex YloA/Tae2 family protein